MKDFEFSIDREIEFMIKYNLTADELFTIKLILMAQDEHKEYLKKFFSQGKLTKSLREILFDLQEKGLINQSYDVPKAGKEFIPEDVEFNKNVIKTAYQYSQTLGMELFKKYPSSTTIDGRIFSLRNITKLYKSFEEFCFAYGKEIKFNPDTHKEIMELLDEAIEKNWIKSGLCDFVASHKWEDFKDLQTRDNGLFETGNIL